MMFKATFNNISIIVWRSVLLVEETRVTGETTDLSQVTDKLYHIMPTERRIVENLLYNFFISIFSVEYLLYRNHIKYICDNYKKNKLHRY